MRVLLTSLFLLGLGAGAAAANPLSDVLAGPAGGWLLFGVAIAALALFALLCRQASAYLDERMHASRVARLMDVLASQADGIVGVLLAHPPAPSASLAAVRDAAIAQGVAYVKTNLPDTLRQIGVPDGVLATRLGNFVSEKLRQTPSAAAAERVDLGAAATAPQPAANPAV